MQGVWNNILSNTMEFTALEHKFAVQTCTNGARAVPDLPSVLLQHFPLSCRFRALLQCGDTPVMTLVSSTIYLSLGASVLRKKIIILKAVTHIANF